MASSATTEPTAMPAVMPFSFAPVETLRMTNMIEIGAGNITHGVNHRQHDQPKRKRHAGVRNRAAGHLVDDDRAGAAKNQRKGANQLREIFFHAG